MKYCKLALIALASISFACSEGQTYQASNASNIASNGVSSEPAKSRSLNASVANTGRGSGSGSGSGSGYGDPGGGGGGREEAPMYKATTASLADTETSAAASARKIIRNAELNLESDSPEDAQKQITTIVESNGGFVVESQQSSAEKGSTSRDSISITLRIPADKFDTAIGDIRKTASRVVTEAVKGQDVTEEFIDIEADLTAKKALEAQFMEIMKRANTVEDALDVQRQLSEVRSAIEKIEGRKRFLENQSALSTVKVQIKTPAAISANSEGFGNRITQSFGSGIDIALNFILGLVTLVVGGLPFLLFIGVPTFYISRYFYRRHKRPMSVSDIAKEEIKTE